MLKIILAVLAVGFVAFALWRQASKATPRIYTKVHVVGRPGEPAHPELEPAIRSPFASSFRRKHLLTPFQLMAGMAFCGLLFIAIVGSEILFMHQHFHIKARLGLEKPEPASAGFPAGGDGGGLPSNP